MCTILTPFHLLKTEDVNRTKSEDGGGEKKGGLTAQAGVPLSLRNRYHNTDVWTFLNRMIMIEHMKMMQMPFLNIKVNASFWASTL